MNKKKRRYIRENYLAHSDRELARNLGLREEEVKKALLKLGLKRQPERKIEKALSVGPRVRALFLLFVILMGILLYANTLQNEFVWDDQFLVVGNLHIRSIKYLPQIFTTDLHHFGSERSNFYRPLQGVSYMIDYAFGGLNVLPFRVSSLLLHLLCALLAYFAALKISKNELIAFLTAFIFVAHPAQTETVTYLSDRADLLAAVFIFGAFLAFIHYYQRPRSALFYAFNLCFILGLLSKEIALVFFVLVFVWGRFFAQGKEEAPLRRAYFSVGAISCIYIILRFTLLRFRGNALGLLLGSNEVFWIRFLTMLKSMWRYFVLLVFPNALYMERNFLWVKNLAEPALWAGAAVIAFSVIFAKRAFSKKAFLSFAVFFFYLFLFPMLNIIPVNAMMSEHWLYLPIFGFALILASGAVALYKKPSRIVRLGLTLILCANFIFYAYKTITRNSQWRDEETLYRATLRYQPRSARVYYNLGNIYALRDEFQKAIENYVRAIELQPDYSQAWGNLGLVYYRQGKGDLALKHFRKAIKINPDLAAAHNNLGLVLYATGKHEQAKAAFQRAISCQPDYAEPYNGLGIYYANRENLSLAAQYFREALKLKPDFQDAADNLRRAEVLLKAHRKDEDKGK